MQKFLVGVRARFREISCTHWMSLAIGLMGVQFTLAQSPESAVVVINELHYDNAGADQAEFVEIAGTSGTNLDGWTIVFYNGGTGRRYAELPLNGVIPEFENGYGVVAFEFAGIQNGGPDGLALVDANGLVHEFLSYEGVFTAADGPAQSIAATGIGFSEAPDTPVGYSLQRTGEGPDLSDHVWSAARPESRGLINTDQSFDIPEESRTLEIFEIQGDGRVSRFEKQSVTTRSNVVTVTLPDGFFMQTPEERSDGNPSTSDGVFVFTGSAPRVTSGDLVDVSGTVVEYFGLTEITETEEIRVMGSSSLPPPVVFDAQVPGTNPEQQVCYENYECFEGMLVTIPSGMVTGQSWYPDLEDHPVWFAVAGGSRSFREPGIAYPGMSGLPVWDGNPEIFAVDPDRAGLDDIQVASTSEFSTTGVMSFEFGRYVVFPEDLHIRQADMVRSVREPSPGEVTVGTLNLGRLVPDDPVIATRLSKLSVYIRDILQAPDVLAVQEAADFGTLQKLANWIALDDPSIQYTALLMEGYDQGGIDSGFLVRKTVSVESIEQLSGSETYHNPENGLQERLHDRPPLLLTGHFGPESPGGRRFAALVIHIRSLVGIETERVRLKRFQQARSIARTVQDFQRNQPEFDLFVLGDFNSYQFSDGIVDVMGQITGAVDSRISLISGDDLVNPDLVNTTFQLLDDQRYSFVYNGTAQMLDHILVADRTRNAITDVAIGRGNADAPVHLRYVSGTPARSSDHDGMVIYLDVSPPQVVLKDKVAQLWPPNHQYEELHLADLIERVDGGSVDQVYVTSVTSDEEDNGMGDGNRVGDMVITGCQSFMVRRERTGRGNGRVYTVNGETFDEAGNVGYWKVKLEVPKSKKRISVDDGVKTSVSQRADCRNGDVQQVWDARDEKSISSREVISASRILENYPNPFDVGTQITYEISDHTETRLSIYNILGQEVRLLVDEMQFPGRHVIHFDASGLAPGLYVGILRTDTSVSTRRMIRVQ